MSDTYLFDVTTGSFATAANWDNLTTGENPSSTAPGPADTATLNSNGGTITGPGTAATLLESGTVSIAGSLVALNNFVDSGGTSPSILTLLPGASLTAAGQTNASSGNPDIVIANYASNAGVLVTVEGGTLASGANPMIIGGLGAGTLVDINGGLIQIGRGTLTLNGATLTGGGFLGEQTGTSGTLDVLGSQTVAKSTGALDVGVFGTGLVTIGSAGTLITGDGTNGLSLGLEIGSSGTLVVSGAGSTLANSGLLAIGSLGSGTFEVLNGAVATSGRAGSSIAAPAAAIGATSTAAAATALVSGTGSDWIVNGVLVDGLNTQASLTIAAGGTVTATELDVAPATGAHGTVAVTGTGSVLSLGALDLGGSAATPGGTGSLSITNGARVGATSMAAWNGATIALDASSFLEIGTAGTAAAGTLTIDPGATLLGSFATGAPLVNNGTLLAENGLLNLPSVPTGSGILAIGTGGTLELGGSIAITPPIMALPGADETLVLDAQLTNTGTIDFANVVTQTQFTATATGGTLLVTTGAGIVTVDLSGIYANPTAFYITGNGTGGSYLSTKPIAEPLTSIVAALGVNDTMSNVSASTTGLFAAPIANALNVAEIVFGSATLPSGYQVGVLVGSTPGTLTDNSLAGGNLLVGDLSTNVISSTGADTVKAGGGTATLTAGAGGSALALSGTNTIVLGAGASASTAGGSNVIFGSTGNDFIVAGAADTVVAGAANTTIAATAGGLVYGGTGSLSFAAFGTVADTIVAGSGSSVLFTGTSGGLSFAGANTTLVGGAGSDTFIGGTGRVLAFAGGTGNLFYDGTGGGVFETGTAGSNTVVAGFGNSTVFAGGNNDLVFLSGTSSSIALAGAGNETLYGGYNNAGNLFYAGPGNDVIAGGGGSDTFVAGTGNTTIVGGSGAGLFAFVNGDAGGNVAISNFTPKDLLAVYGYSASPASIAATQQIVGGSTVLSLPDKTTITLVGVAGIGTANLV